MCLENILHLFKIFTKVSKELQYVGLLLDLQRIATCKNSKNYNLQIYNLIYKELQLEKW